MAAVAAIRFATPGEREALGDLHRRSSLVWEEDRANLEAHPEVFGIPAEATSGQRVRVAVDEEGAVLGFSVVADAGEGVCELEDLFVEPAIMRGGVGTALVEDVATRHAAAGFREIVVTAAPRTFGFYESVGFTVGEPVATRFGPAARLRRRLG